MVNIEKKVLGIPVTISVPATLAENVALCGSEDVANQIIIDHELAHNNFGDYRADFLKAIQETTGITRKTKVIGKKKDGTDIVEWDEKEEPYFERVLAQLQVERTSFQAQMDAAVAANPYNPKPSERKPKAPRTPTKGDASLADAVIKVGGQQLADVLAALSAELNRTVTVENLAVAIMDDRLAEAEKIRAAQAVKFGVSVAPTPAPTA